MRRMFADVDADVYVLADGDATYKIPRARIYSRRFLHAHGLRVSEEAALVGGLFHLYCVLVAMPQFVTACAIIAPSKNGGAP